MESIVSKTISNYYAVEPVQVQSLGGGFYGRVFLAQFNKPPFKAVVKLYLFPALAKREALQLETLKKHALIKVPEVYFVQENYVEKNYVQDNCIQKNNEELNFDLLIMEYIEGINAGKAGPAMPLSHENRERITQQAVENLIVLHSVSNEKGFGELNDEVFCKDWRRLYKEKMQEQLGKGSNLYHKNQISKDTFSIMDKTLDRFDQLFYLPIKKSSLIHGDYNAWNILLNPNLTEVAAIIDPFNCCWADQEFDLYQLDNANGKWFGFLDRYKTSANLSENFPLKRAVYELFTEVMHYHDANIDAAQSAIERQALSLREEAAVYGIRL